MILKAGILYRDIDPTDPNDDFEDATWEIDEGSTIDVVNKEGDTVLRIQPEDFQALAAGINEMIKIYDERAEKRQRTSHR
jgi:hypothetical protein